jgi:hypothetical protein
VPQARHQTNRIGNVQVPFMPSLLPERGFTFYTRSIVMWNKPTARELRKLPGLRGTEDIPAKDKIIHIRFFFGASSWYAAEFDGGDTFFGFVVLNGDWQCAEWGYFSLAELDEIVFLGMEVGRDVYWKPVAAGNIETLRGRL